MLLSGGQLCDGMTENGGGQLCAGMASVFPLTHEKDKIPFSTNEFYTINNL